MDQDQKTNKKNPIPHYYGDFVRKLLLGASAVLLVEFLLDQQLLGLNLSFGIFGVLILTLLAGYTSPESRKVIVWNMVFTALSFLFFEYLALREYSTHQEITRGVFIFRQATAIVFLVAFYFSTKTVRGFRPVPPQL
jgi:hypothetical protein